MNRPSLRLAAASVFLLPNLGALQTPLGKMSEVGSAASIVLLLGALAVSLQAAISVAIPDALKSFAFFIVLPTTVAGTIVAARNPAAVETILPEVALPLVICAVVTTIVGLSRSQDLLRSLPIPEVLILHLSLLATWAGNGFPQKFLFFANQKNVIGGTALAWVVLLLVHSESKERDEGRRTSRVERIALVSAVLVIFASGSRTALGGALIAIIFHQLLRRGVGTKVARVDVGVLGLFLLPPVYLSLGRLPFFEALDEFVQRYTGNPIYSGREQNWVDALRGLDEFALTGTGSSQSTTFADGSTLHAHNLGLVKFYSSGLISAVLMSLFFVLLARHAHRRGSSALSAGVLGLTFHQLFEANLSVGGVPVGIALAFVVGTIAAATSTAPDAMTDRAVVHHRQRSPLQHIHPAVRS